MAKKAGAAKGADKEKDPQAARMEALAQAMGRIEKAYGRGAIMKMGDEVVENVEVIPTGSISLNYALGVGGYPKGRIIEIYGPESSGKTTLAIHAIAEAQKRGGIAAMIDAEHASTASTPSSSVWTSTTCLYRSPTTASRRSR